MASSDTAMPAPAKGSESPTTTAGPVTSNPATPKPLASVNVTNPAVGTFKIVKVRKPDGTIVRVRRPIVAGSTAAAPASVNEASKATSNGTPSNTEISTTTPHNAAPILPIANKDVHNEKPAVETKSKAKVKVVADEKPVQGAQNGAKLSPVPGASAKPAAPPAGKQSPGKNSQYTGQQSPNIGTQGPVSASKHAARSTMRGFSALGRIALSAIYPDLDFDHDDNLEDGGDMLEGDEPMTDGDDDDSDDDDEHEEYSEQKQNNTSSSPERKSELSGTPNANDKTKAASTFTSQQRDKDVNAARNGITKTLPNWLTSSKNRRPAPVANKKVSSIHAAPLTDQHTATAQAMSSTELLVSKTDIASATSIPSLGEQSKPKPKVEVSEKQIDLDSESGKPQLDTTQNHQGVGFVQVIVWIITISFPLLFLILGIFTSLLNGASASSWGVNAVEQSIKIAITSWPIFFAAVVAQSLKALATYRVERGIRLKTLEQLVSSTSFASAIKQPFFLRKIDLMSVALLILWSLSPLASQALQRMSGPVTGTAQNLTQIWFLDTNGPNPSFALNNNIDAPQHNIQDSISDVFSAAMLPRGKQDPPYMDPWRYPLIPSINEVVNSTDLDADQWYTVDLSKSDPLWTYSSTLGIPYMDLTIKSNGTYSFILNSSYFSFSCPPIQVAKRDEILSWIGNISFETRDTLMLTINPPTQINTLGNLSFASLILTNTGTASAPTITSNDTYAYATCNLTQVFVQSDTFCDDRVNTTDCKVQRIRLSPNATQFARIESFADSFVDAGTSQVFTGSNTSPNMSTFIERYLFDPAKILHNMVPVDLTNPSINSTAIERRLGRLFNTYWQAGFAPMYQTGFSQEPAQVSAGLDNFAIGKNHHNATTLNITATFTDTTPQYIVYVPWLVCLIACSVILLVVGVGGVIWEYRTVGPNILGFANSIVRQSQKVKLPAGAPLKGPQRTRMVGDIRVMMQDVRPKADVGKLALGTVSDNSKRLQPGRLYV